MQCIYFGFPTYASLCAQEELQPGRIHTASAPKNARIDQVLNWDQTISIPGQTSPQSPLLQVLDGSGQYQQT